MAFSEALKEKVRRRAHLQCCLCKVIGVEVHHIVPVEQKGKDTEDNAAPLCPSCHEAYGANPKKRKFIREARDLWYEICEKRFASDPDRLNELKDLLKNTVSFSEFNKFKKELLSRIPSPVSTPRSESEIIEALGELFDKVWYDRHMMLMEKEKSTRKKIDPKTWAQDVDAEKEIRKRYHNKGLGPWNDFEWGMINGKLSALRWVLGDEWDMLDT